MIVVILVIVMVVVIVVIMVIVVIAGSGAVQLVGYRRRTSEDLLHLGRDLFQLLLHRAVAVELHDHDPLDKRPSRGLKAATLGADHHLQREAVVRVRRLLGLWGIGLRAMSRPLVGGDLILRRLAAMLLLEGGLPAHHKHGEPRSQSTACTLSLQALVAKALFRP